MAAPSNPMGLMPPQPQQMTERRVSVPNIPLMVVVTDVDGKKSEATSSDGSRANESQSPLLSRGILKGDASESSLNANSSGASAKKVSMERDLKGNTKWRRICKCFIGLKVSKNKAKSKTSQPQKPGQSSQNNTTPVPVVRRRSRSHSLHPGDPNRSPGRLSIASISPSRSIASLRSRLSSRSETDFYLFDMGNMSEILTINDIKVLGKSFPPSAVGCPCILTFSTSVDGYSLHTLYRKMESVDSPMILAILDCEGRAFGAVLSCALRISEHYYGSSDSFLFRCGPPLEIFKWQPGANFFFIHSEENFLRIGAGKGNFGLCLDDNLFHGRTEECATFGSPPLVDEQDFEVQAVEVWTFGQI